MSICYVIATPIGNLEDITPRALSTLKNVNYIFAEDTRVSGRLLNHFGINVPLLSLHEHNEMQRFSLIKTYLEEGNNVAIISDAGTPLISDPGYPVVVRLRHEGFSVIPIPGVSAIITALSVAGIPTNRFAFEGFLPSKRSQRQQVLRQLCQEERTLIFYESSHRIVEMLSDAKELFLPTRKAFIGREMTKFFEDYRYGSLDELYQHYILHNDEVRGEFVVVVTGAEKRETSDNGQPSERILAILLEEGISVKQAATIAAKISGQSKNALYQKALTIMISNQNDK